MYNQTKESEKSGVVGESSEYRLFIKKGGKDLRETYDDLGNDTAFSDLSTSEMDFVWAYACRTSPFAAYDNLHDRIGRCFEYAYEKLKDTPQEYHNKQTQYLERLWGQHVSTAIERMKSFNPSLRTKEYEMYRSTIESYETILINARNMVFPKGKTDKVDMDEAKKYVDLSQKINSDVGELIRKLENSTGVTKLNNGNNANKVFGNKSDKQLSPMERALMLNAKRNTK